MIELGSMTGMALLTVSSLGLLVLLLVGTQRSRLDNRLHELASQGETSPDRDPLAGFARAALPRMGAVLLPRNEKERTRLQVRLIHAGLYGRQAMGLFLGVKLLMMLGPPLAGLLLGLAGFVPVQKGMVLGCFVGSFGIIAPSYWLDRRKAQRQVSFRRALPDAMDVLVICLEGGGTLPLAIHRVSSELRTAHPLLAAELNIVQREIQLGRAAGEALRQFAERADLEEIRSLASVVLQADRYGASLVKALRVHADTLRQKRLLHAEEMAQQAAVKLLFPTVLFIMPAMLIVVLGPAVMIVVATFRGVK